MPTIEPDAPAASDITPAPKRQQNNEMRLYLILAAVVVVGFSVMFLLDKMGKPGPPPTAPEATPRPPLTVADVDRLYDGARHKKGDPNAKFTIVEFADFQCPSCRRAYEQTISTWDSKIPAHRFGFYHLPLVQMHERAMPAAIASEAAAKQGKFWQIYDAFFQKENEDLTDEVLENAGKKIGLNMTDYKADQANPQALQKLIQDDVQTASTNGFESTPTFLIHDASGNTARLAGAGNLKRLLPDLKDGILGNDKIEKPTDPDTKPTEMIQYNVGGKQDIR